MISLALLLAIADPVPPVLVSPIQFEPGAVTFVDAPNLPKGAKIAVLEGDPKKDGIFTIRLQAPKGFVLPMHTHPADERVTVLSGSIAVSFDGKTSKLFKQGGFYVNPKNVAHSVSSDEGFVIQITGVGPWTVTPVSPPAGLVLPPTK